MKKKPRISDRFDTSEIDRLQQRNESCGLQTNAFSALMNSKNRGSTKSPPKKSMQKKKFAFIVMLRIRESGHSDELTKVLETCEKVCPEHIHKDCFQHFDSLHFTLLKTNKITHEQASQICLDSEELKSMLPLRVGFNRFHDGKTVLLLPDSSSSNNIKLFTNPNAYAAPDGVHMIPSKFLHVSLYRVRTRPKGLVKACTAIKEACSNLPSLGSAVTSELVIKQLRDDYKNCYSLLH
eukprot:g2729.t1